MLFFLQYYDYDISSLPLPCRDPFFIDMKQVVAVLQDLKVTTQGEGFELLNVSRLLDAAFAM